MNINIHAAVHFKLTNMSAWLQQTQTRFQNWTYSVQMFGLFFLHNKTITSSRSFKAREKWVFFFRSLSFFSNNNSCEGVQTQKTIFNWNAILAKRLQIYKYKKKKKKKNNLMSLNCHHSNNIYNTNPLTMFFCNFFVFKFDWIYIFGYVDELYLWLLWIRFHFIKSNEK